jgi:hypothetical protein
MSTELYFQIEARNAGRRRWWHLGRIRLSQDHLLFELLAGGWSASTPDLHVECLVPKGLPHDVTELSLKEGSFTVDDDAARLEIPDTCSRAAADEWANDGRSRYIHNGYAVTRPEFHSHSWVTIDEFRLVRDRYRSSGGKNDIPALNSVVAMMESLANDGIETRAVFWFGE